MDGAMSTTSTGAASSTNLEKFLEPNILRTENNSRKERMRGMSSSRHELVVLVSVLLAWVLQGDPVSAEGWPTYRHDPKRTARQTLAGDIDVPAVGWSFSRGGRLGPGEIGVADVNLDREPEAVLLRGGRAVTRR